MGQRNANGHPFTALLTWSTLASSVQISLPHSTLSEVGRAEDTEPRGYETDVKYSG